MNAREYYSGLQAAIHAVPHVWRSDLRFEEIDEHECYVSGVLLLMGGFELYVAEYVVTSPVGSTPQVSVSSPDTGGQLVSRWDNATHHPDVPPSLIIVTMTEWRCHLKSADDRSRLFWMLLYRLHLTSTIGLK